MPKAAPKRPRAGRSPAKGTRPKLTKKWIKDSVERFKDVKDAVSKKNVHQEPRSKQAAKLRHTLDNPFRSGIPKESPHVDRRRWGDWNKLKKGGKVKRKK
jgi:hypothetical protein